MSEKNNLNDSSNSDSVENEDNFGKIEDWDFDDVQEAEMVEEKPKKKKK